MYPPIYSTVSGDPDVQDHLGNPPRFYPFGEARQDESLPYAVWQTIGGSPENYLNEVPDIDSFTLQVDVYSDEATKARRAAVALRDAIEPHAHITGWRIEARDPKTRNYRISFDVDWWASRDLTEFDSTT